MARPKTLTPEQRAANKREAATRYNRSFQRKLKRKQNGSKLRKAQVTIRFKLENTPLAVHITHWKLPSPPVFAGLETAVGGWFIHEMVIGESFRQGWFADMKDVEQLELNIERVVEPGWEVDLALQSLCPKAVRSRLDAHHLRQIISGLNEIWVRMTQSDEVNREVTLVEELLNRLESIYNEYSQRLLYYLKSCPDADVHTKLHLSSFFKRILFWHLQEIHMIRSDLRMIWTNDFNTCETSYHKGFLGWQWGWCWRSENPNVGHYFRVLWDAAAKYPGPWEEEPELLESAEDEEQFSDGEYEPEQVLPETDDSIGEGSEDGEDWLHEEADTDGSERSESSSKSGDLADAENE